MRQYRVPAVEKTVAILELLAAADEECSATEISARLGIPKATVFMLLHVLERHELAKKNGGGRYTLGVKLYELGMTYLSQLDVVRIAHPQLAAVTDETGLTAHLGIIYDRQVLFIDKVEPRSFVRFSTFVGLRSDVHMCSLGKAMAAYLGDDELTEIIAARGLGSYTVKTITDVDRFREELAHIRRDGYAVENEEGEISVRCVGAPIFDRTGAVHAAISVTGLVTQLPTETFPAIGERMRRAAALISRELGFGDPATTAAPPAARDPVHRVLDPRPDGWSVGTDRLQSTGM